MINKVIFYIVLAVISLVKPSQLFCQSLEAKYSITKGIFITRENGRVENLVNLTLTGFLYQNGNKYISFSKPDYLQKYPNGLIDTKLSDNSYNTFELNMDTLQNISYKDFDTLIYRYRFDISGNSNTERNFFHNFESNFQTWEIMPDTNIINGLLCQKAITKLRSGKVGWEVWFCPSIPSKAGPDNIFELPGLMIEGENKVSNEKYVLESYKLNVPLPKSVFWPNEFNQPFKQRPTLKKRSVTNNSN